MWQWMDQLKRQVCFWRIRSWRSIGLEVKDFDEMLSYLFANIYPGDTVKIDYIRGGEKFTTEMVIGARPSN